MKRGFLTLLGVLAWSCFALAAAQPFKVSFSSNPPMAKVCNTELNKCFSGRIDARGNSKKKFTLVNTRSGEKVTVTEISPKTYRVVHTNNSGKVLQSGTIKL